ncbi:hypothetical protein FDUTEX481_09193 [Tolypothrix sp. PCC 7601]|nr:hypothetical protein FDUTEX481_09193 [Tolypothrix sp. PCC 7601]
MVNQFWILRKVAWAVSAATRAAMPPSGLPNPKGFPDLSKLSKTDFRF